MSEDHKISELMLLWEESRQRGQPANADELCRDCQDLLPEVKRRIVALQAVYQVLDAGPQDEITDEQLTATTIQVAEPPGIRLGPPELPAKFGRYRVKTKLGGGGMGTVYLVENTELEREEALKVPHFSDCDDLQLRERFLREARSAAKLDHANLCPVYDAGVQDGIYYMTMRFLKGKLLSAYTCTAMPSRKAVEIVTKLAQALEAAHAKGVIHRDLKPSNVMMVGGVGPVVMDFGLAKQVKQPDRKLTQSGAMLGTPSYMPPEQVKGELEKMGPASDVYSLGVILYELLTGRLPFDGAMGAIFGKILYTAPPLPSALVPRLNPALDVICRKAMAKASTERYPSMKTFAAALLDYLRMAPATAGAANLVPAAVDKAANFQAPPTAPDRVPAGKADIFQASTGAPGPLATAKVPPRVVESIPVATTQSFQFRRLMPARLPWVLGGVAVLLAGLVGAYFLTTIILRVETKAGTLLLEIDEKDAEVYVDGDKITIGRPGDKNTITVEAKEGKHLLRVTKVGFEAWTDNITFRANEPNHVKISLKPSAVALNEAKAKNEPAGKDSTLKKKEEEPPGKDSNLKKKEKEPPGKEPTLKKEEDPNISKPSGAETFNYQNGPLGMKFVRVPKGTFWMGWDSNKKQSKQVPIAADFEMAAHTVTQAQWQEVMGDNPSKFSREGPSKQAVKGITDEDVKRFPVESVSWYNVQEFLKELNARETGRGWLYRLPSEAEWEYACRGGATSKEECSFDFCLDKLTNDLSSKQANFNGTDPAGNGAKGPYLGRPTKVGSYAPNKLGLYDMHGNVWQWCSDLLDEAGSVRVVRGGGWGSDGWGCRATYRVRLAPTDRDGSVGFVGFRLARVPSGGNGAIKDTNTNKPLDMKFVKVPNGTFWMGWDSVKKQSKQVTIEQDFEMAAYTVTQAQWQEVMGYNPSYFSRQGNGNQAVQGITDEDLKRFPVENVSWKEVKEFLKKLNASETERGWLYGRGWLYRLPSEAEWEYACRGGATSKEECSFDFYLDKPSNDLSWNQANFWSDNPARNGVKGPKLQRTQKAGSYAPNQLGLYDMHGNVWQWCSDLYDGTGLDRVIRGGSWYNFGRNCRAASRTRSAPAFRGLSLGFRLARVPSGG